MTHQLNDDGDVITGHFSGEFGKELFTFRYERKLKTLFVDTTNFGRRRELAGTGIERLSDEELHERLIEMAPEVYENLLADPPIK